MVAAALNSVFREKGGDLYVWDNGKKVEQEFCGVSHGSLSSNCTVVMLGIESARDVDQDLSAFEQMSDGFFDFRHRINCCDGDAQRTGGNERSGFDLRRQDLRHMIEIAQEEAFHCQVFAYEEKGVDRHRPSGRR